MKEGTVQIPLEDIEIILCIGAKIRFSTMGLGEITNIEAQAASVYFQFYHKGLNRRSKEGV